MCDNDEKDNKDRSEQGLISDILDGVVFAPVGTQLPRPPPDFRSRSNLSSFRELTPPPPPAPPAPPAADVTSLINSGAIYDEAESSDVKESTKVRVQSPLPALPAANRLGNHQFENPLYEALTDCHSGDHHSDRAKQEATYADIDDGVHYQIVTSDVAVAGHCAAEQFYDCVDHAGHVWRDDGQLNGCIYENVDDVQTYANISLPADPVFNQPDILTALILDLDPNSTSSSSPPSLKDASDVTPTASSSGNSSLHTSAGHSPNCTLDALIGLNRRISVNSCDSALFTGLLRAVDSPAHYPPLIIRIESNGSAVNDCINETLKQFEQLEQESNLLFSRAGDVAHVYENQMDVQEEQVLDQMSGGHGEQPASTTGLDLAAVPVAELLDLLQVTPSRDHLSDEDGDDGLEKPEMPLSPPPPTTPQPELPSQWDQVPVAVELPDLAVAECEGIFKASVVDLLDGPCSLPSDLNSGRHRQESGDRINRVASPSRLNIGARIAEDELKLQQRKDAIRSEMLGIENIGESFDQLERSRCNIIGKQSVKAKRLDSWVGAAGLQTPDPDTNTKFTEPPLDGAESQSRKPDTKFTEPPLDGAKSPSRKPRYVFISFFLNR